MLLKKGRKNYEILVVTLRVKGHVQEDFMGVFKTYDDIYKNFNLSFPENVIMTVWQMNVGDRLGEGIFDFDMGVAGRDYIIE